MRIPVGAVGLRIPLFHAAGEELRSAVHPPWPEWMRDLYGLEEKQDDRIDVDADITTVPAALGALASRLRQRLELLSSLAAGLERAGWDLHIDGDALIATRSAKPQHALEMLEAEGLSGPLCAVADMDDAGWPRLYDGHSASG